MSLLIRIVLAAMLTVAALLPAAAQTSDQETRVATPTSFLEACADKIENRGRLRFCDTYFREKLGTEADALLYLRDRITRLRAGHEASSAEKYQSFLQAIYIVAFLTIASIVLIASDRRIGGTAKWAGLTSTAALLVMVLIVAMGWLGKYRAEYAPRSNSASCGTGSRRKLPRRLPPNSRSHRRSCAAGPATFPTSAAALPKTTALRPSFPKWTGSATEASTSRFAVLRPHQV